MVEVDGPNTGACSILSAGLGPNCSNIGVLHRRSYRLTNIALQIVRHGGGDFAADGQKLRAVGGCSSKMPKMSGSLAFCQMKNRNSKIFKVLNVDRHHKEQEHHN